MSSICCYPPIAVSPALQGALKDCFGEAVVAHDLPEPCEFPYHDSCQKRFLQAHKRAVRAPRPVIGLVLQVGDMEKLLHVVGLESPDPFLRVS